MKKTFTSLILLLWLACSIAQTPQKMSYQCVVRNSSGTLITNQSIGIRISILQGSTSGNVVFQETYDPNPQTNANGLLSIEIGGGIPISGTFSSINWTLGTYFLKTETDPSGGTNYTISGTNQLLSVPYAMHAKTAENGFSGNYNDLSNLPVLYDGTWTNLTGKPFLATVATSGSYNDLTNKPILFDGLWTNITGKPNTLSGYGITDGMSTSHVANSITSADIANWNTGYGITDVVTLSGNQTITGIKTYSNDILINGLTIGTGKGSGIGNTAFGSAALYSNTTGNNNIASGSYALNSNTTGHSNVALGAYALYKNQFGGNLVAIGDSALYNNIGRTSNDPRFGYAYGISNTAVGSKSLFSNTDGNHNTASGYQSLYSNTTGYDNTASGYQSLYSNTTANSNTAIGYQALFSNLIGFSNIAIGTYALFSNTTGEQNTATGRQSLYLNTTGSGNQAYGPMTLYRNTTGALNTAIGIGALNDNTTGWENVAVGAQALQSNTDGGGNIAIGFYSLENNITGNENIAIGYSADVSLGNLENATVIGNHARVDASNKIRIGNTEITVVEGQVDWSVGSDKRLKDNIEYSDKLGLEFVNGLKTVTFTYKNDSTKKHNDGLIGQDVKQVLVQLGLEFSGLIENENEEKILNLSYAKFVIPLINSVKELSNKNQEQLNQIESYKFENDDLKSQLQTLQEKVEQIEAHLVKSAGN